MEPPEEMPMQEMLNFLHRLGVPSHSTGVELEVGLFDVRIIADGYMYENGSPLLKHREVATYHLDYKVRLTR